MTWLSGPPAAVAAQDSCRRRFAGNTGRPPTTREGGRSDMTVERRACRSSPLVDDVSACSGCSGGARGDGVRRFRPCCVPERLVPGLTSEIGQDTAGKRRPRGGSLERLARAASLCSCGFARSSCARSDFTWLADAFARFTAREGSSGSGQSPGWASGLGGAAALVGLLSPLLPAGGSMGSITGGMKAPPAT